MGLFGNLFGDAKARQKKEWEKKLVAIKDRLRETHDQIAEVNRSLEKIEFSIKKKVAEIDVASDIQRDQRVKELHIMDQEAELTRENYDSLNATYKILVTQKSTIEKLIASVLAPGGVDIAAEAALLERKYLELEMALEETERLRQIKLSGAALMPTTNVNAIAAKYRARKQESVEQTNRSEMHTVPKDDVVEKWRQTSAQME